MKIEYRIVKDAIGGYEVQFKPTWLPFWFEASRYGSGVGVNSHSTLELAEETARKHAEHRKTIHFVKKLGVLP